MSSNYRLLILILIILALGFVKALDSFIPKLTYSHKDVGSYIEHSVGYLLMIAQECLHLGL